ncbi:hypothetical protein BC834DRAFT_894553 [Gloeopeniophorella convolvens]|nr:hypothetical protein BC834DRAFT_894553 [Gloeopeniophorella convolvens]
MLTTQAPVALPRIHSLYSELPPNSRRAANLPFFATRTTPAHSSPSQAPLAGSSSSAPPFVPRRNSISRRNAISYHPSQPASENPFADPKPLSAPPASPRPRSAVLVSSGYTTEPRQMSYTPPLVVSLAPARVPRTQRDYQAKMVANLLLNRAGRARPMRCARRGVFLRSGYQRSSLSACVVADEYDDSDTDEDAISEDDCYA